MEYQIWKYILTPDKLTHEIPKNGIVRYVDNQDDNICLWVEVNPEDFKEKRHFEVFGTGHPINYDIFTQRTYLGSVKLHNGSLIFHVYERET